MDQRVVCAAVRNKDGLIVCGARHFDLVMGAVLDTMPEDAWLEAEQGFIDRNGNWLTREEAWEVAMAAGQIIRRFPGDTGVLYSENLY